MLRRAFYNTSAQLVGKTISAAAAFAITLLLARALGVSGYGQYTLVVTYVSLFFSLIDFGINPVYLRDFKQKIEKQITTLVGLRLFIGIVLMALAIIGAFFLNLLTQGSAGLIYLWVCIGAFSIVGYGMTLSASALFQFWQRYDLSTIATSIGSLVTLALLFVLYPSISTQTNSGVLLGVVLFSISAWITAGTSLGLLLGHRISVLPRLNFAVWKKIWLTSLPLGLALIFNIVYFRIDTLVLASFRTSAEVGAYGLAYKFFEFALVLPTFFMNSIYPDLLKTTADSEVLKFKIAQVLKLLGILSILVMLVTWLGAPFLVFIKSDFAESVNLLRLLGLSLPLFYLSSPLMWWFILLNKQKQLAYLYAITMAFNVIVNLIVIPWMGAVGAAITTGLTELLFLCLGLVYISKHGTR